MRGELDELFASRSRDEWVIRFATVDCCVTPVLSPEEALKNEQIAARGMVVHAHGLTQFAPPLKLSEHEFAIRQTAPKAGEHNASILAAAGYSAAEISAFRESGVLG